MSIGTTVENSMNQDPPSPSGGPLKRTMDMAMAVVGLLFLVPVFAVVAVYVWRIDRGQVLFGHKRRGRNGESFICYKFRTMVPDAKDRLDELLEKDPKARAEWQRDQKLRNDPRILGKLSGFLRRTSLDELPQLINVLRGDMSMVGPRPIVDDEVGKYGDNISDYDRVRPGLTGLWQISGRNDTGYEERVALDVSYAQERTLLGDIAIVFKTIPILLSKNGAY